MIRSKNSPLISGTQFSAIVVLTIVLFLVIDLGRRTTAGYHVSQAEKDLMAEIRAQTALKQELKARLEYVKTDAFVEQWAREQARMVRKGDRPLIVVRSPARPAQPEPGPSPTPVAVDGSAPNWHEWWRLFFNSKPGTLRS
jgi:cell division protein FtsB